MRQYTVKTVEKVIEETKLDKIICNQCGQECGTEAETFVSKHCWGYGSKYDMECHRFDLCESCYDQLIEGFQIPVKVN